MAQLAELARAAPHTTPRHTPHRYAEDPQLGWRWPNTAELKRYCSGMGFMMTQDVVQYIADNAGALRSPEMPPVGGPSQGHYHTTALSTPALS